jgi:arylsulfatase A-like enzyme
MRPRIFCSLFLLLISLLLPASLRAAERPNIVWIVSEDNSKHYLKLFDENGAEAPNIEALAAHGIAFTHAFSNAPVCSVARTTLATGACAPRLGTQFHRRSKPAALPADLKLFTAYLREAGYYTSNHSKEDYNTASSKGTWDDSSKNGTWRNRPDKSQAFFHMQSHSESHESSLHFDPAIMETEKTNHDPAAVHLPPYFPDTPLFRYTYARYLDRMQVIDGIVGETVAKLKADGLLEDTFIFYFGDHGGVLPRSKGYLYESGLHVPLVVRIPENWKNLSVFEPGSKADGFVSFIDFAPTALHLAGVEIPDQMDGKPFLGKGLSAAELNGRDTTFGYADRFDEKYDLSRSLRTRNWKYIRSYQPQYPDGLQNNYRYFQPAYREWRDLFNQGILGVEQRQFFEAKAPEMLFDLSSDPHEVKNLAGDPAHRDQLLVMRKELQRQVKSMPDLGFFPESVLYDEAMSDPTGYGKAHLEEIEQLVDTADLMLSPFPEVEGQLRLALASDNANIRYWALDVCTVFGEEAIELVDIARPLLKDASVPVRIRAAEFLGSVGKIDPRENLIETVNTTRHPVEQLIALQTAAFFQDRSPLSYPFDATAFHAINPQGEAGRRIDYFSGTWLTKKSPSKKKAGGGKK